jgi:hypothetical protein
VRIAGVADGGGAPDSASTTAPGPHAVVRVQEAPAPGAPLDPSTSIGYAITMTIPSRSSLLLVLIVGVAACGSDSPTAPTPASAIMPTLSSIQSVVFNDSCAGHHGDHATEADLDLTAGESYDNLVNVPSIQVAFDLVEPNDAENSYLVHKLDGRAGIVGVQMPVGGPFLSQADIDVIKQWINAGAQNN